MLYWFCHISTWIRHRYTCVPHPEPSSLPVPSLWVVPVHQPQKTLVSGTTVLFQWNSACFHVFRLFSIIWRVLFLIVWGTRNESYRPFFPQKVIHGTELLKVSVTTQRPLFSPQFSTFPGYTFRSNVFYWYVYLHTISFNCHDLPVKQIPWPSLFHRELKTR